MAMATDEGGELKGSGRRKLQGALDELVQQVEERQSNDITEDSAMEEAAKSLVELPNSIKMDYLAGVKKKGIVSPRKRRRKKKKELMSMSDESDTDTKNGVGRHIPHVMTLFDRRVDLARFSETTPLYVMCREWMRNKPQKRQPQNSSVEQTNSDFQDQELPHFPSPEPLGEGQSSSIPVALPPHGSAQSLDHELEKQAGAVNGEGGGEGEGEGEGQLQDFKKQHLHRWKKIRSRWTSTSIAEQERYKDSLKILRDMFQR